MSARSAWSIDTELSGWMLALISTRSPTDPAKRMARHHAQRRALQLHVAGKLRHWRTSRIPARKPAFAAASIVAW